MTTTSNSTRILSIQSHVAFGYVGGKAAVFPLQCLGYDVDVINTVNFSNHSAYHHRGGSKTTPAELEEIFAAMESNGLLVPGTSMRLLTGYTPNAESLETVGKLARRLREGAEESEGLIYLLDPVLGDSGRLYVSPDCISVYRSMLPLATIITPNWFEVETLTDTPLTSLPALRTALRTLHETYHVPHVVITSIPLSSWLQAALPPTLGPTSSSEHILCLTSSANPSDPSTVHALAVPTIPGYFTGVGDLFSALVLGNYKPPSSLVDSSRFSSTFDHSTPLSVAASSALCTTHLLITQTHNHSMTLPQSEREPTDDEKDAADEGRKRRRMRGRELKIVQGRGAFTWDRPEAKEVEEWRMKGWEGFW